MNKLFDMCTNATNNNTSKSTISNIEKINSFFKLPISYNNDKMELSANIVEDLELIRLSGVSSTNVGTNTNDSKPLYKYAFQPKTNFGDKITEQFAQYYTTDIHFLKDSQKLLKTYNSIPNQPFIPDYNNIIRIWDEIKNDNGFKEKYHYIDWPMWEYLNNSDVFLQLMSMYNLASPVLSLLVPVVILIMPFFIIKMKGLSITISEYMKYLNLLLLIMQLVKYSRNLIV